jgi:hypothetical protein
VLFLLGWRSHRQPKPGAIAAVSRLVFALALTCVIGYMALAVHLVLSTSVTTPQPYRTDGSQPQLVSGTWQATSCQFGEGLSFSVPRQDHGELIRQTGYYLAGDGVPKQITCADTVSIVNSRYLPVSRVVGADWTVALVTALCAVGYMLGWSTQLVGPRQLIRG